MLIGWVIALTLLAFLAGWFFAGAFHVNRAEDTYREGYAKGLEDGARESKEPAPH